MIYITGEINEEAYTKFCEALDSFDQYNEPIEVHLNSGGGDASDAIAMATRMRLHPYAVNVTVYGQASSAAVIILAYGARRRMTTESWVMVHEESDKISGDVRLLEREVEQLRRVEKQWAELLAERTKVTASYWESVHSETTYLSAEECLELGLIDEVI